MTNYTLAPNVTGQFVNWDDPSIWAGGIVPATPDADVLLPAIIDLAANSVYSYDVAIRPNETYSVRSVTDTGNFIALAPNGTLNVAGAFSLTDYGELDISGGTLTLGALQNAGVDIQGNGLISSTGAITNVGEILGSGLTLDFASLTNTGTLDALGDGVGTFLTVDAPGSGGSFAGGTLTGGTYAAAYSGTLNLDLGGVITVDDATISLGGTDGGSGSASLIDSLDPATGAYVPLTSTLQTIAASGSLVLASDYTSPGTLTVAGTVSLSGGTLSAGQLDVVAGGSVTGSGTLTGPIVNAGTISAGDASAQGTLLIDGAVSGPGVLAIAPAVLGPFSDSDAGGDIFPSSLELGSASAASVVFGSGDGTLTLDDPAAYTGTITVAAPQFEISTSAIRPISQPFTSPAANNTIILSGIALGSVTGSAYVGDAAGGTLTLDEGSVSQTLRFAGDLDTTSFRLFAGPQPFSSSPPSLEILVAPIQDAPTIALQGAPGDSGAIVNTATPTLTGTISAGTTLTLLADGTPDGSPRIIADAGATTGSYTSALANSLAPGAHQLTVVASNAAASIAAITPLSLFVLPDPVAGITTAAVSSAQLAGLLSSGFSLQFIAGTEAVQLTDGTLSVGPDTGQALVQRLYEGLLGRAGDTGGLASHTALLGQSGADAVATSLLGSAEYQALHGPPSSQSDAQFVTALYAGFLGRAPDQAGFDAFTSALASGVSRAALAASIAQSPESKTYLAPDTAKFWVPDPTGALITQLFETGLDRAPDLAGLASFSRDLAHGATPLQLAQGIASSPEFLADHAGQNATALITSFYADALGRAPDPSGLQNFLGALQSSGTAPVLLGIANSPEAYSHLLRTV